GYARPVKGAGALWGAGRFARMIARAEVVAARLDPLHGMAEVPRREGNQEIVGVELAADPERAAGIAFHHADVRFLHAEQRRQDAPAEEWCFRRAPDREPLARPFGEHAARLEWHRGVPMHAEALTALVRRIRKRGLDLPAHS